MLLLHCINTTAHSTNITLRRFTMYRMTLYHYHTIQLQHCTRATLNHYQSVPIPHFISVTVPLLHCTSVKLYHYHSVPIPHLSVSLYHCSTVPVSNCTIITVYQYHTYQCHCTIAPLYQCQTVPLSQCTNTILIGVNAPLLRCEIPVYIKFVSTITRVWTLHHCTNSTLYRNYTIFITKLYHYSTVPIVRLYHKDYMPLPNGTITPLLTVPLPHLTNSTFTITTVFHYQIVP